MGYGETLSSSDSKEFGKELKDVENKETDITFSSKNCNSDNLNREIMSGMETNVDGTKLLPLRPIRLSLNIPKDIKGMDNMANTKEMSKYIGQALSILYHGYAWSDLSPKQKYEVLQVGMGKKIDDDNKGIIENNTNEYEKLSTGFKAIYKEVLKDLINGNHEKAGNKLAWINRNLKKIQDKVTYVAQNKSEQKQLVEMGYDGDFSIYKLLPDTDMEKILLEGKNYPKYTNFNEIPKLNGNSIGYNARTKQLEMTNLSVKEMMKIESERLADFGDKIKNIVDPSLSKKIDELIASLSRRYCDPNNPNTKGDIDKAKSMFLRDLKPMIDNEEKKKQCRELGINIG